jgi:peptide chain release factor 2
MSARCGRPSRSSRPRPTSSGGCFDLDAKRLKIEELESLSAAPSFWDQRERAQAILKEQKSLKALVDAYDQQLRAISDAQVLLELAEEASDEASGKEAARDADRVARALDELEFQRMLSGEFDNQGAIVQIQSGAGGVDASDWAEMLERMIIRYAERKGWKVEILDEMPAEEAGIKGATLVVTGDHAFGLLKAENGVHRLVRVSPFDQQGRRQTSFAAITVTPDIDDDIEVDVKDEDLKIDTYRAGGAGGQHVNKTDSAVRITHIPTGTVTSCQLERSQVENKNKAWKMMVAKLQQQREAARLRELQDLGAERGTIGWGHQIRSYVLHPYQMVKDLRTGHETSQTQAVLAGDLQPFIDAYLRWRLAGCPPRNAAKDN